jgi:FtsZ-binding cell division protein ZapB
MSDSVDKKLDRILGEISHLREKTDVIASLVLKVNNLEAKVATCEATINLLVSEVKALKNRDNDREQDARHLSLRIFNIPGSNSETGLSSKVYDEVLKPILAAAKSQGEIPTLPHMGTAVSEVFRAGKFSPGSNKPPPPL